MLLRGAHFQLTGRCNLHCRFCGQSKGMLAAGESELPVETWLRLALEVRALADTPEPEITLWGGEPLLYERFDELARHLHDSGFELGVITNGTLIDRHAELLNRCFKTIYISLDGDAPYHNRIRGKGVFERVAHNVSLLKNRSGRLIFLSTLADENVESAPELPLILGKLGPDLIHLQRLMYFTRAEIDEYRAWLRREFQTDDPTIEVWHREDDREYRSKLDSALAEVRRRAEAALEDQGGRLAVDPGSQNQDGVRREGVVLLMALGEKEPLHRSEEQQPRGQQQEKRPLYDLPGAGALRPAAHGQEGKAQPRKAQGEVSGEAHAGKGREAQDGQQQEKAQQAAKGHLPLPSAVPGVAAHSPASSESCSQRSISARSCSSMASFSAYRAPYFS